MGIGGAALNRRPRPCSEGPRPPAAGPPALLCPVDAGYGRGTVRLAGPSGGRESDLLSQPGQPRLDSSSLFSSLHASPASERRPAARRLLARGFAQSVSAGAVAITAVFVLRQRIRKETLAGSFLAPSECRCGRPGRDAASLGCAEVCDPVNRGRAPTVLSPWPGPRGFPSGRLRFLSGLLWSFSKQAAPSLTFASPVCSPHPCTCGGSWRHPRDGTGLLAPRRVPGTWPAGPETSCLLRPPSCAANTQCSRTQNTGIIKWIN